MNKSTSASGLDTAYTELHVAVGRTNWVASGSHQLGALSEQMAGAISQWQVWSTAGLSVTLKQPAQLWPRVAEVPASFTHPQAIKSNEFIVSEVPAPFVKEVVQSAPQWVSWESVRADLSEGDMRSRIKFTLTGIYYAKAN